MLPLGEITRLFLDARKLDDAFVDCALSDESVNSDLSRLTQTMSTIHSLCIIGRIPIVIVEDNSIGSGEVDTKPTSPVIEKSDK